MSNRFGLSSLEFPELVDVDRQPAAVQRDDDAEPETMLEAGGPAGR